MRITLCLLALLACGCTTKIDEQQMKAIIDRLDAIESKQGDVILKIDVANEQLIELSDTACLE